MSEAVGGDFAINAEVEPSDHNGQKVVVFRLTFAGNGVPELLAALTACNGEPLALCAEVGAKLANAAERIFLGKVVPRVLPTRTTEPLRGSPGKLVVLGTPISVCGIPREPS